MQMAEPHSGRDTNDSDLMEVLMALKANIMRDLHVGTFAIVKKVDPVQVEFFPKIDGEEDKLVEVECTIQEVYVNDVVYVVFADRNFLPALRRLKKGQKMTTMQNDSDLHSEKYGIAIAKLSI